MSILSTSNTTIEDNQESVSSQPTEVDTSGDVYEELALNDHHHIQANSRSNLADPTYGGIFHGQRIADNERSE